MYIQKLIQDYRKTHGCRGWSFCFLAILCSVWPQVRPWQGNIIEEEEKRFFIHSCEIFKKKLIFSSGRHHCVTCLKFCKCRNLAKTAFPRRFVIPLCWLYSPTSLHSIKIGNWNMLLKWFVYGPQETWIGHIGGLPTSALESRKRRIAASSLQELKTLMADGP